MESAPTRVAAAHKPTARVWIAIIVGAAGAVLLFLGWYGVSGENSVAQQLPYLASASIPGAALLIAGAVLAARERDGQNAERLVSALFELLTEPVSDAPVMPADERLVALPGATRYHHADCLLVVDKPDATTIDSREIAARGLEACPLCVLAEPAG